jgi:hypothetical protein
LRRANYKAAGLTDNDYFRMTDKKKLEHIATLTEEQKTVIRRDFLHYNLTERTTTVSSTEGTMMLAFAKLHLPGQTAIIETSLKEQYDKKNARLDERIAELKKQMAPAKADAKATEQKPTSKAAKPADTVDTKEKESKKAAPEPTAKPTVEAPKALPAATVAAIDNTDGEVTEQQKEIVAAPIPAPEQAAGDGQSNETPILVAEVLEIVPSRIDGKATKPLKVKSTALVKANGKSTMPIVTVPTRVNVARTA